MNDGTTPWLRQHRRQSAPGLPPSVALCRALQLGDMLCAVSARRALRAALPATRITLVGLPWTTQFASHFAGNIDDFVAFPGYDAFPEQHVQQHKLADFYAGIRARRFDMAIRLHGSGAQSKFVTRAFSARTMAGYGDERPGDGEYCIP